MYISTTVRNNNTIKQFYRYKLLPNVHTKIQK